MVLVDYLPYIRHDLSVQRFAEASSRNLPCSSTLATAWQARRIGKLHNPRAHKKQCPLCFEELKVYTILFRNQNTMRINDFEKADEIISYKSIHYQIWHYMLGRAIHNPILLLPHDLDDGTDRLSQNVGNSLPICAAYCRRRAKVYILHVYPLPNLALYVRKTNIQPNTSSTA